MATYSEDFAGGATTANTILTLAPTAGWQVPPGQFTIYKVRIGYANIVNAKEAQGFLIIQISGQGGGTWAFAYGGATGATTDANTMPAEEIDMSIPVTGGQTVKVQVITAEVHNDTRVGLMYTEGGNASCMTLCAGGAGQDVTAGTELALAVNALLQPVDMTPWKDARIRQIRFAGSGVAAALSGAHRIRIIIPGQADVYKFIVGSGPGGAATGSPAAADVISGLDIPVKNGSTVTVKVLNTVTTGQATLSAAVSLLCM